MKKCVLLVCSVLLSLFVNGGAAERPLLGVTDGTRVEIVDLGLSVQPPKGWRKQGRLEVDARNYRFPWFISKSGLLQFALVDERTVFSSLQEGVLAHLKKSKLEQKGEIKQLQLSGQNVLLRVKFTEGVVRYYFQNEEGKVGFMHFIGAKPNVVEQVIIESAKF